MNVQAKSDGCDKRLFPPVVYHHDDECTCPRCYKSGENGWSRTLGVVEEAVKRAYRRRMEGTPAVMGPTEDLTDTIAVGKVVRTVAVSKIGRVSRRSFASSKLQAAPPECIGPNSLI